MMTVIFLEGKNNTSFVRAVVRLNPWNNSLAIEVDQ